MTTESIISLVTWQGMVPYRTRKGIEKPYLSGIPSKRFWSAWKRHKETIRSLGIDVHKIGVEKTGDVIQRKGRKIEIRRAQWEVRAWRPSLVVEPEQTTNQPF